MANTTQKKTTTRATNAKGTTKTPVAKKVEEEVVTEPKVEYVPVKKQEVDMNQTITVRNGFHGILVYKSRRTGEEYVWNEFGDEQDMELSELKNAKDTKKKFFEANWFVFDDEFDWVLDFLKVRHFYKNAMPIDDYDEFFKKSADEIIEIINGMSDGQKKSLAYRAKEMIEQDEIDSISVIKALEEGLGIKIANN